MTQFSNVYLHFPFCESKCHYCDFFSLAESRVSENSRNNIYTSISSELDRWKSNISPLETLFIGGGTPSLVPIEALSEVLSQLPLRPQTEVTLEANPSSVTLEKARAWKNLGINRISMGTQALDDDRLKWLGRVHSKQEVFAALDALFTAGFERVSIDYIVGVPDQTTSDIKTEISGVLKIFPNVHHLSAYLLTLNKTNPKFTELPNDETQLAHLKTVSQILTENGFEQYEISNFSRPGYRAQHNENYWLGGGYLGVGPSAHSFWPDEKKRTKNVSSLSKYEQALKFSASPLWEWEEILTPEQERIEYLMLRLRRSAGIDLGEYERQFGENLYSKKRAALESWIAKGLCRLDTRLQLTAEGFFLSDQILSNII